VGSASIFRNFFGGEKRASLSEAKTALDMVTGVASLVSNPADIDAILDDVRSVTSRLQPGEVPSLEDDSVLLGVYLRLEEYLTTRDPVRTFTKEELRKRLENNMRLRVEAYEAKG